MAAALPSTDTSDAAAPYADRTDASSFTPSLELDPSTYDLSDLSSIKDGFLLTRIYNAGLITQDDYVKASAALLPPKPVLPPPDPKDIKILYTSQDPPIIAPETAIMQSREPWQWSAGNSHSDYVTRLNETMLMKRNSSHIGIEHEAKTILFVQQHTNIPIPRVHLVFTHFGSSFLVMEYVDGEDLQHRWETLEASERHSVLEQVQRYLQELRSITPVPSAPGPLSGGRCEGPWFSTEGSGPFVSHQHLVKWLNSFIESPHRRPLSDHRFTADAPLVFTHSDFVPRNLIWKEGTLWVVDWALAGWYPPFLEYSSIAADRGSPELPTPSSWREAVLPLLGDYRRDYELLYKVSGYIITAYRRSTISPPREDDEVTSS